MEIHFENGIKVFPKSGEVHFCDMAEGLEDTFSTDPFQVFNTKPDDVIPWSSEDCRLEKTSVFIERFFNKTPCRDLAERFKVKENTIVSIYKQAVEQLYRMIEVMDSRKEGLKDTQSYGFTDEQKFFLLVAVFGFNSVEVSRMFGQDRKMVSHKVKRMSDKYKSLFSGAPRQESAVDDPPMGTKLPRGELVRMVEAYAEQGLSHREAFRRIADRQGEILGRPVNIRAVESRFYKATAL